MKNLIPLIKDVEIEMRSNNGNITSKPIWERLSELTDWQYRIIQDAMLRVRIFMQNNDPNFVYQYYNKNIDEFSTYKRDSKIDLFIAALKRDQRDTVLTDVWNRLYYPSDIKYKIMEIWGNQVTKARNIAVQQALLLGSKYLLFVDDDILVPNNGLMKLLEISKKYPDEVVFSGQYYRKIDPLESAHHILDNADLLDTHLKYLDLCAMGFTLIDLEYISKHVPMPLFWEFGSPDGYWSMGEDAFFTKNLFEYTKKRPILDTSIKCLHYDKTWKRSYGEKDPEVTYASNAITNLDQFERLRVPKDYPFILICIPTRTETDPIAVNLDYLPLLRGYRSELFRVSNLGVAEARTVCVQEALKRNADYLLFIDDDVIPPLDGLDKLIRHIENKDIDVISGDYLLKGYPTYSIHLQLDKDGKVNELERIKDLPEVFQSNWMIGLGFVLFKTRIFKEIRQPWFLTHTKNPRTDTEVNEDAHISELLLEAGYNIYVDRSIQCLHLDFKKGHCYSFIDQIDIQKYSCFPWLQQFGIIAQKIIETSPPVASSIDNRAQRRTKKRS